MSETNGRFISKTWLISILIVVVGFLGALGITDHLAQAHAGLEKLQTAQNDIAVLQTNYENIKAQLNRIESKVDRVEKKIDGE